MEFKFTQSFINKYSTLNIEERNIVKSKLKSIPYFKNKNILYTKHKCHSCSDGFYINVNNLLCKYLKLNYKVNLYFCSNYPKCKDYISSIINCITIENQFENMYSFPVDYIIDNTVIDTAFDNNRHINSCQYILNNREHIKIAVNGYICKQYCPNNKFEVFDIIYFADDVDLGVIVDVNENAITVKTLFKGVISLHNCGINDFESISFKYNSKEIKHDMLFQQWIFSAKKSFIYNKDELFCMNLYNYTNNISEVNILPTIDSNLDSFKSLCISNSSLIDIKRLLNHLYNRINNIFTLVDIFLLTSKSTALFDTYSATLNRDNTVESADDEMATYPFDDNDDYDGENYDFSKYDGSDEINYGDESTSKHNDNMKEYEGEESLRF